MKSVPAGTLFFKPMKEEPNWVFLNEGDAPDECEPGVFVWYAPYPAGEDGGDVDWQGEFHKAPYLPGEKCYVRETWGSNMVKGYEGYGKIFYRADMPDQKTVPETYGCPWRSPVTMPAWAARRFVVILSCEPVRVEEVTEEDCKRMGVNWVHEFICDWLEKHPGKEWAWRVVSEEGK